MEDMLENFFDENDPDDAVQFVPYEKQDRSKYSYGYMNEDGTWEEAEEEEENMYVEGYFCNDEEFPQFDNNALYVLNPGLKDLIHQNIKTYREEYTNKYELP